MIQSLTAIAMLRSGEAMTMRPLRADDAARFAAYLGSLSEQTRARWGPHRFDPETAHRICGTLDATDILRVVGTIPGDEEERIIAYVLLKMGVWDDDRERYVNRGIPLDPASDATLAPSVADDYQNQGVGSLMMGHILEVAGALGRRRVVLWGGVQATNDRAVHFYTKWGFRNVGEFWTDKNNYDMIRERTL
jgi:diamine N-acetyltransferase